MARQMAAQVGSRGRRSGGRKRMRRRARKASARATRGTGGLKRKALGSIARGIAGTMAGAKL
jgi:hypothetical protein